MAHKRNLKERLGLVSAPAEKPTPEVSIPAVDSARDLADAATSGFAAIQALFAERNQSIEHAQSLHRHNVYLLNVNNGLQAQCSHLSRERDHYLRQNAALVAHLKSAYDVIGRVLGEIGHTAAMVEVMGSMPQATNNPEAPELDTVGRPVDVADVEQIGQDYDEQGRPSDSPPAVTHDDLRALAAKLAAANGSAAVQ